ncbi:MAG: hypothetical protein ACKOOL_11385 [Novosphingobium sp.]
MIARMGSGWQTVLADLSLILFMITAASVNDAKPQGVPPVIRPQLPAMGEPVAVWSAAAGGPSIRDWLARTAADPRLRLTILAPPAAAQAALELAQSAGRPARLVIEPGMQGSPLATLTYDQAGLAQPLPVQLPKEKMP